MQMVGTWRGFSTAVLPGLQPQPPQPYNFSIPASCPSTTVPHLSCTLSHFFTIFSAYQAGLVSPLSPSAARKAFHCCWDSFPDVFCSDVLFPRTRLENWGLTLHGLYLTRSCQGMELMLGRNTDASHSDL